MKLMHNDNGENKNKSVDMEMIDRYLRGEVSEDEKAKISQQIAEDQEVRELFDDMEIMAEGIRSSATDSSVEEKLAVLSATIHLEEDMEADPSEADEESEPEIQKSSDPQSDNTIVVKFPIADLIYRYKVAIAASVALVAVSWFAIDPFASSTGPELFVEHFKAYPNDIVGVTRGADQQVDERGEAYLAYDQGDYAKAVDIFSRVWENSNNETLDLFYLGNAYLMIGSSEKAIASFKMVADAQSGLTLDAKWFLGLSYLQTEELDKAKVVFSELAELGKDYAEDAEEILDELD